MTSDHTPRQTKGERTKQRILEAALELFSEQGFASTSVRDIAARAKMTHAGLLHHFDNKDDLLLQILEYREAQDEANAARFRDFGIDRLFAWVVDIVRINSEHADRVALFVRLSAEATDPDHPAHAYFTRRYERILAALEGAFADHFRVTPPTVDVSPGDAARSIVALMDGLQVQWLILPGSVDMTAAVLAHLKGFGITVPETAIE